MGGKSCCVNATVKTWEFTQPWYFLSLGLPDRIQGLLLVLTQERSWWLRYLTRDWVLSTSSNLDAGAALEAASAGKSQKSGLFRKGAGPGGEAAVWMAQQLRVLAALLEDPGWFPISM